jgi:valacyclovir hydrolase
MPEIAANGTLLHYQQEGTGEPLLLLHGGLGTALLHWRREIPFFARYFRVIAPDLRGYGRSSPPREFPVDFYQRDAEDMAALLRALTDQPAHVIGWSDGGMVALVLAVKHPSLVRTLTTIGAEARLLLEERAVWPLIIDTSGWSETALQRFIEAQGPSNWPGILQRMIEGYGAVLDAGGEVISARAHEITCATLLLHGENDVVVPVSHAHELHAAIRGSELHIYPGAGHQTYREHEQDFRERVLDFLRRHSSADLTPCPLSGGDP